jgi:hypothetical protein
MDTIRIHLARRSVAIRMSLLCRTASVSRADSTKRSEVWVGILVLARTRRAVLPRTLDVRQLRRTVLGMRKASGMESNKAKYIQTAEH